jgi:hypothetical protein
MTHSQKGADRSKVSTYLGPRSFYAKDMANKHRVGQSDAILPPRCAHCRRSFHVVMVHGVPHCPEHFNNCDCEESDK